MSLADGGNHMTLAKILAARVERDLQFSNIFTVDIVACAFYVAATLYLLEDADPSTVRLALILALALLYFALHAAKMLLVVYLEQRGGDARQFMGSDTLVTSGVYAWSRNPVYLMSIVQSFLWSALLAVLARGQPAAWFGYALASLLLYVHFWGIDRLIIPNEEAALGRAHPKGFAAYASRVRRWIGWKAAV
jgi:protein-S-isoprenylcysteine O-methyltransferase Ste14